MSAPIHASPSSIEATVAGSETAVVIGIVLAVPMTAPVRLGMPNTVLSAPAAAAVSDSEKGDVTTPLLPMSKSGTTPSAELPTATLPDRSPLPASMTKLVRLTVALVLDNESPLPACRIVPAKEAVLIEPPVIGNYAIGVPAEPGDSWAEPEPPTVRQAAVSVGAAVSVTEVMPPLAGSDWACAEAAAPSSGQAAAARVDNFLGISATQEG